jgi:hypothetical protein
MKFPRRFRPSLLRSKLRLAMALGLSTALLSASLVFAGNYGPVVIHAGNLVITADGGISPSNLPKHERVPIEARIQGSLKTLDGSQVPPASDITVEVDKDFAVNAEGLPVCHLSQLVARSTSTASRACRGAIVGRGFAEAEVALPEQPSFRARGPLLFFNGGVHGKTTLLYVHLYAAVPAPTAIVAVVHLMKIRNGRLGTKATVAVPKIASGYGSIVRFGFSIGRDTPSSGGRRGYVEAMCSDSRYLTRAEVTFVDGLSYHAALVLPCGKGAKGYGTGGGYAGR